MVMIAMYSSGFHMTHMSFTRCCHRLMSFQPVQQKEVETVRREKCFCIAMNVQKSGATYAQRQACQCFAKDLGS